jgi:hypothetical protein
MFELNVQSVSIGIGHVSRCVEGTLSPRMVASHFAANSDDGVITFSIFEWLPKISAHHLLLIA